MKKNLVPLLAIAFIVAIASTGILYGLFAGKLRENSAGNTNNLVAVAAHNLNKGAVLTAADIKLVQWPAETKPKGAFAAPGPVVGQTLLEPVQENEPLTQIRLASKKNAGALGVPAGMRAVSVRVSDAPGVAGLLRPGHKVDVQYLGGANSQTVELKTILQNLEVLAINPQVESVPNRNGTTVVTLLATPAEADLLSLADSNNRLRLTLRNPIDDEKLSLQTVSYGSLTKGVSPTAQAARTGNPVLRVSAPSAATAKAESRVVFSVRFAGAQSGAFSELGGRCTESSGLDSLCVSVMKSDSNVDALLKAWEAKQQISVLRSSLLSVATNHEGAVRASATSASDNGYGVALFLKPAISDASHIRLRVQPEVRAPRAGILSTRRIATDLDLADGQTFVVTGFVDGREPLLPKIFTLPAGAASAGELIMLITPKMQQAPARSTTGAMP